MSADAPAAQAHDEAAERRAARLRATGALTRIGLKFAAALEHDLDAAPKSEDARPALEQAARAFAQVSRAVSLAVALEDRLDQDPETRRLEAEARAARARTEAAEAEQACAELLRPHRRRQIKAALEAVLAADARLTPRRRFQAQIDLDGLIDRELADLDRLLRRPAGETIARLARRLGLDPDWATWITPWAREAETAQVRPRPPSPTPPEGSPLASTPTINPSFPGGRREATADPGPQPP